MFDHKIETERLILRRWKEKDFPDFTLFAMDPEVMLASGSKPMKNAKDRELFNKALKNLDCYAIILRETGRPVGMIKFQDDFRRYRVNSISLGYELSKQHWGKGYMPEALRAMVKHAFEKKKVDVVGIGHFTVNDRSRRVIEKSGFKLEGIIPKAFKRFDGAVFDDMSYSIVKEDYFSDPGKYNGTTCC